MTTRSNAGARLIGSSFFSVFIVLSFSFESPVFSASYWAGLRRKVEESRCQWLASCFMPSPIFVVLMSNAILDYKQCNHDPITNNYTQTRTVGAGEVPASHAQTHSLLVYYYSLLYRLCHLTTRYRSQYSDR